MPGLDGLEGHPEDRPGPRGGQVLILTMYVEEQLVARCLDAGARGCVLRTCRCRSWPRLSTPWLAASVASSAAAQDQVVHVRGRRVAAARTRYDRSPPGSARC